MAGEPFELFSDRTTRTALHVGFTDEMDALQLSRW